jgi:hypothetical protein
MVGAGMSIFCNRNIIIRKTLINVKRVNMALHNLSYSGGGGRRTEV